jgi:hypothetical protein
MVAGAPAGVDLYKAELEGMSVAGFETNQYFGLVVSDLGQDKMVQLAAGLAPALRNALDGNAGTEKAAPALLLASVLTGPGAEYTRNITVPDITGPRGNQN